jgi:hypothetical protein
MQQVHSSALTHVLQVCIIYFSFVEGVYESYKYQELEMLGNAHDVSAHKEHYVMCGLLTSQCILCPPSYIFFL